MTAGSRPTQEAGPGARRGPGKRGRGPAPPPAPFSRVLGPAQLPGQHCRPSREGSAPVALEQVPGDHQPLDLTGALINLCDAGVAVVPLRRHLCHVAHAAQDLHGLRGNARAQERKTSPRPPQLGGETGQDHPRGRTSGEEAAAGTGPAGRRQQPALSRLPKPGELTQAVGTLTWWVMAVAASDAASLAIAAS